MKADRVPKSLSKVKVMIVLEYNVKVMIVLEYSMSVMEF